MRLIRVLGLFLMVSFFLSSNGVKFHMVMNCCLRR